MGSLSRKEAKALEGGIVLRNKKKEAIMGQKMCFLALIRYNKEIRRTKYPKKFIERPPKRGCIIPGVI